MPVDWNKYGVQEEPKTSVDWGKYLGRSPSNKTLDEAAKGLGKSFERLGSGDIGTDLGIERRIKPTDTFDIPQIQSIEPLKVDNGLLESPGPRLLRGFEKTTGLDRIGGAMKGLSNPTLYYDNPVPEDGSYLGAYKSAAGEAIAAVKNLGRNVYEGFAHPDETRQKFDETVQQNKSRMDPVTGFAYDILAQTATDPLSYFPLERAAQGFNRAAEVVRPTETLALPPSRFDDLSRRAEGTVQPPGTEPIIPYGESQPLGLPEANVLPPTGARIERRVNPYEQKFNDLMAEAQQTPMMPGREYESLQDLWSRRAGPQDPGLDELINLAYPQRTSKLNAGSLGKARELQRQREVYGVPSLVKGMGDRYQPFIGEAAMPETKLKIGNFAKTADNVEIIPPKRNFESSTPQPEVAAAANSLDDASILKDISGFSAQTRDFYRNMEAVLGKEGAKQYTEPFNAAKKANIDNQEAWLNRLKTEVVDKLGIDKGSKLSAMVQKYGEKQISLDELKQQAPKDWEKVVKADDWFRKSYDDLIDKVNASRAEIYPTNPDKQVPKRQDYYRHFQELNGLEGLKNIFDTPAGIDPHLAGISEFVTPKSKWASFMQKRGLGPFKNDAVGGFLNYLPSASYAIHIDPQIEVFRGLRNTLADKTGQTRNVNNFIEYLNDFSNDLAGKTNPADRFFQKVVPGGRKTMAAIQWLNNRVKANVILGNISSTLAQTANIPNGIAFAKQYSVKGAGETLAAALGKNSTPMEQSGFLKERFAGQLYREFNTKWLDQPRRFSEWMMETADRSGTYFVWNSAYTKAVAEKVADPIAYADDAARKLVAGRGIGEVPILQKSKLVQIAAPFQLEVANLWRVMGDFVKAKDFGAIATLFVGNYLFNRAMEQVRGSGVTFDPIQAIVEAAQPGLSPLERGGRLGGEVLSNLPLGQTIANQGFLFPEYGGTNAFGVDMPTRKKLFGDNDPTRFGTGLLVAKGLEDPLYKAALPFGGSQLKKTIQGIDALQKGGDYSGDKLKFLIEPSAANIAKLPLLGPSSTGAARDYYKNDRRPLTPEQTKIVQNAEDQQQAYDAIQQQRRIESLKSAIIKIQKDQSLSDTAKGKKINPLLERMQKAANGG